ncbi:MAG TPA: PIG-L deacetylase family protein [Streptosporangiaceae bacterium]
MPGWPTVLVVIAHPDDESFGLGAVIDQMTGAGAAVHVVCFTHGEASTLNETRTDLHAARCEELAIASSELGIATVDVLDYPDGELAAVPAGGLAARVLSAVSQHDPDGLLVFDDTGITGHPDHRAATAAALEAARQRGLPVLAWTLPDNVASQLRHETGQRFAGQPPDRIDVCVQVSRHAQHRASLAHASQISPSAVLWRRLHLLGDHEHLRWLPGSS